MRARFRSCPRSKTAPAWHAGFLAMLPMIRRHARIAFRYIDPDARDEAVQAVVCNAMAAYLRLCELNKTSIAYPGVLARYGVAQVKDGRIVGGRLNGKDASSAYCRRRTGIVVERLDQLDREENAWREVLVEDRYAGPADTARARLDFAAWLRSLPSRLRRLTTEEGKTAVVVTHDQRIFHFADRIFWLENGRVAETIESQ